MWKSADGWLVARVGGWVALDNSTVCSRLLQSRRWFVLGKWFCESVPTALTRRCIWFELDFYWSARASCIRCSHATAGGTRVMCFAQWRLTACKIIALFEVLSTLSEKFASRALVQSALHINPRCTSLIDELRCSKFKIQSISTIGFTAAAATALVLWICEEIICSFFSIHWELFAESDLDAKVLSAIKRIHLNYIYLQL